MIRDSVVYVNMDKIVSDELNYTLNFHKDEEDKKNDIDTSKEEGSKNTDSKDIKNENLKSFVYIRPLQCDSDDTLVKLSKAKFCKEAEIIKKGYDSIFLETKQTFRLSLHYMNYHPKYVLHFNKIMKTEPLYFSIICDPLQRAIRHFNHSNSFNHINNFDEYYYHFGDKKNVGWTGIRDVTNNYFCNYLGFEKEDDITEENINERFSFIMVCEKPEESYKKLEKCMGLSKISNLSLKKSDFKINNFTEINFKKNNALDYKLYELCCKMIISAPSE